MRILRPLILFRLCRIFSERIGHFIPDSAEHLARRNYKSQRTIDLYFFGMISNHQWAKMVQRSKLFVLGPWLHYLYRWNQLIPGGQVHQMKSSKTNSRDIENLFGTFDVALKFSEEENSTSLAWLKERGWKYGEPFVCLIVRDSKYLSNFQLIEGNYDYHNYRNSEINTYIAAVRWLNSRDVWVIRMGKEMLKPMEISSEKFIDYAFDPQKSDLLDIWLFANSAGIITTGTGPDGLAAIYRKPTLCINVLPLIDIWSWSNVICVPKNLFWKENGRELSLTQLLAGDWWHSHDFESRGIHIEDLSDMEILHSVKEFWQRIEKSYVDSQSNQDLQYLFRQKLMNSPLFNRYHKILNPCCRVGAYWISTKQNEFFT